MSYFLISQSSIGRLKVRLENISCKFLWPSQKTSTLIQFNNCFDPIAYGMYVFDICDSIQIDPMYLKPFNSILNTE